MLRLIVCDWNGTLFGDTLEETFFFGLCRRAVRRAAVRADVLKLCRLAGAGTCCLRQYLIARRDRRHVPKYITRIVALLNRDVCSGIARGDLDAYVQQYARRVQPRLDERLLGPLKALRAETSVPIGVMSSACRRGIEAALDVAGLRPDFIVANDFRMEGDVTAGFEFAVAENKGELLRQLLAERNVRPADVMYIGDSPQDEMCFRLVGMPVMSFLATEVHRRGFGADCQAFAPADQAAFEEYLRRVTAKE
jgi:beta-phosphoglucomutase-like phosphatase (HAD superfamily)